MNKPLGMIAVLVLVLTVFLGACAPKEAAVPATQKPAPAAAPAPSAGEAAAPVAQARAAWEVEWEKTLEAAKKEQRVRVNLSGGGPARPALMAAFKEKYSLDMEIVSATGSELSSKITAERRAGIYEVDIHVGGSSQLIATLKPKGFLDPLGPALVLPELTDPEAIKKNWWKGEMGWADKEHMVMVMMADPKNPITINTTLVSPGEIKSYQDVLNPKYLKKIAMRDPSISGDGGKTFGASIISGVVDLDYWRKLAKQEPFITRDPRLLTEGLAHGKYALVIAADPISVQEFKSLGAPIQSLVPAEGTYTSSSYGNMGLINKAPHPNATKLFINWLLTREGQTVLARGLGQQSRRLDVATDHLFPSQVREAGVKYFDSENEQVLLEIEKYYAVAKDVFGIGK